MFMRVSSNQQSINFNAIPLAQWRCKTLNNKIKNITIASFEPKEEFISEYRSELKSFCNGPTVAFENNATS